MQAYSDPRRASDPYALPDVEVWHSRYQDCRWCQHTILADPTCKLACCPECSGVVEMMPDAPKGWYWWSCFPGCLPDSDPIGPFDTEEDALADARDRWEGGDDEA